MDKKNYKYSYEYVTRGRFGIYQETSTGKQDVFSVYDKTTARIVVWYLNGWGVPKGIDPDGETYRNALDEMERQIALRKRLSQK